MPRTSAIRTLLDFNPATQREIKEREERDRRVVEGGRWLRECDYTHKLDVSFPSTMGFSDVREAVYAGFRQLGNRLERSVRWVAVIALGELGGLHHVHALVHVPLQASMFTTCAIHGAMHSLRLASTNQRRGQRSMRWSTSSTTPETFFGVSDTFPAV